MRPIKACFLFIYCLAALTAVGTAVSHLWRTAKIYRDDSARISTNTTAPSIQLARRTDVLLQKR